LGRPTGVEFVEGVSTDQYAFLTIQRADDSTKKITLARQIRHSPTEAAPAPQNAIVLLSYAPNTATNLAEWQNQNWAVMSDGSVQVRNGGNRTRREMGDMQLHIEWMTPYMPKERGQGRGNSGVYLQNRYEVQILDSFGLDSQDNDAGGIYRVAKPRVNASLPPLQWQTYDIMFRAPRLNADKTVRQPAMITVIHNGEIIHENQIIQNPTGGGESDNAELGPLHLQDHGNPVRFRNIWMVPKNLPDGTTIPRPVIVMSQLRAPSMSPRKSTR
jgi:hypothetical protein